MDYKKFAAGLRSAAGSYALFYGAPRGDLEKAADVIEELAAKLEPSSTPLTLEELRGMDCLTKDLRALHERAKSFQQGQAPSPSYSTGRTDGFYEGVRYVFDKIAEQSNEPLTLEELREMDGEPVWIVPMRGSGGFCTWMLVDAEYELCREVHGEMAVFENCGKTWLAYRCRLEEGNK